MPKQVSGEVKQYEAAGGVVAREGHVLVLLRPGRDEIRLPKGHVEPGEGPHEAAVRETEEESGYAHPKLQADLGEQVVRFRRAGQHVVRMERYFLMTLAESDPPPATRGEAQFEPVWVTWDRALEMLTFETEREWVRRGREALEQRRLAASARAHRTVALSTGSLYTYGLARVFRIAAEAGYDAVELLVDQRWDTRQVVYLRGLVSEHRIPILAVHSPFVANVPGWPADQLGRLHLTVALAQELGVHVVVTHLPVRLRALSIEWHGRHSCKVQLPLPRLGRDKYARFVCDGLDRLEDTSGVTIAVENMPARRFLGLNVDRFWFNTPSELSRLPHLAFDTTHLGTWGSDLLAAYTRLRDRVAHVHLSNFDGREHRLPPDGNLPLSDLLQQLAADGFEGTVTVECDPSALEAESPARTVVAIEEALAFCRRHLQTR